MLATLVIGMREGLEASLIVGIIAAFLKRNGKSLRPMWIGVILAVLISIAVGVALNLVSAALPQAQQEGMESVIAWVAIVIVTMMIAWMNKHARGLKGELEASAGNALRQGSTMALAAMAFLAVLKEGFETSVFMLAAFQASNSALAAGAGAVIGVLIAVAIGMGIYRGGVRLNLGRFFKITGVFLVFVAAGLVMSSLRTAHEAGWVLIGQQRTVDLSWLAPNGSIRAALITGVLGIPADPRVVEMLGWFLYLIPVLAFVLWPASRRLAGRSVIRLQLGLAAGLAVVAVGLAALVPTVPAPASSTSATLVAGNATGDAQNASIGTATLGIRAGVPTTLKATIDGRGSTVSLPAAKGRAVEHQGIPAIEWTSADETSTTGKPASVSADQLIDLNGGRAPVGINLSQNPGPFAASWTTQSNTTVWTAGANLLDATGRSTSIVTISGGGLLGPRTLTVPAGSAASTGSWAVSAAHAEQVASALQSTRQAQRERALWKIYLPVALGIGALVLLIAGLRGLRGLLRAREPDPSHSPSDPSGPPDREKSALPNQRQSSNA